MSHDQTQRHTDKQTILNLNLTVVNTSCYCGPCRATVYSEQINMLALRRICSLQASQVEAVLAKQQGLSSRHFSSLHCSTSYGTCASTLQTSQGNEEKYAFVDTQHKLHVCNISYTDTDLQHQAHHQQLATSSCSCSSSNSSSIIYSSKSR